MSKETTGSILTAAFEETLVTVLANLEDYKSMKYNAYREQVEAGIAESVETLRYDDVLWSALPEWSIDRVHQRTEAHENWLSHTNKWWRTNVPRPADEDMWYVPEAAKALLIITTREDAEVLYREYRDGVKDSPYTVWGRARITLPCEIIENCIGKDNRADYSRAQGMIDKIERAYQLVTGARYDNIIVGEVIMQDIADAMELSNKRLVE